MAGDLTFTVTIPSLSEIPGDELERYSEVLRTVIETLDAEYTEDGPSFVLALEPMQSDMRTFIDAVEDTATRVWSACIGRRQEVTHGR